MLGTATVAGLLLGWLRGGTFSTLGGVTPRIPWIIPLAFTGQYVIARATGDDVAWWVLPLHMGSYALLLAGIMANRGVPGTPLLTAGLVLNAIAIGANGGLMPLAPEHLALNHAGVQIEPGQHIPRSKSVLLPSDVTHFWQLTDVLALPEGLPKRGMFSIGDVAIALGVGWSIQGLMRKPHQVNTAGLDAGVGEKDMAINMESAQLVIGAAALDTRFRKLLLTNPDRALREVAARPGAPTGSRLSEEDRRTLATIRASSLSEYARGVEALHSGVQG